MTIANRRRSPRLLCSDIVTLLIETGRHRGKSLTAVIEDVSDSGACVSVDGVIEIESGAEVVVSSRHHRVSGWARHRFFDQSGSHVGIEFTSSEPLSESSQWPEYILDPASLH